MKWLYRNLYRKEKGFTLVELMIVIVILGILTSIAIPSYMALRNRARTAAAQAEMRSIATALEVYQADHESYPPVTNWDYILEGNIDRTGAPEAFVYMDNVPDKDPWGAIAYNYTVTATGTLGIYTLTCYGPDGTANGTDNITMINGQLQE